jgi:hypothetical protein
MRYEPATQEIVDLYEDVKAQHFPELRNIQIMLLMDTKKCKSKGKLVLGKIKKASEVEKYLTTDIVEEEGIDFVMFLDKNMITHCDKVDLARLVRHELRHIFINERGKLTLLPHDFEDFRMEVDLNHDDPNWASRVAEMVSLIYEQREDE